MIETERPMNCYICKKQLYRLDDERYEPEFVLSITDPLIPISGLKQLKLFVHQTCWHHLDLFINLASKKQQNMYSMENTDDKTT